jgi:hypothetical protein
MFSNKGEFQASVNGGVSGFDPQLSYAITDHIGIMANGSFADRTSDSTDNFHNHKFVEIGGGYYTNFGTIGRFETFAGFGMGELTTDWEDGLWDDFTTVKSRRYFIQPDIGISTRIFDGSFATRFVLVDLYEGSVTNTGFFMEPVITAKLGFKYFKATTQFGLSLPINQTNIDFTNEPFIFSIGIQATIGRKYVD